MQKFVRKSTKDADRNDKKLLKRKHKQVVVLLPQRLL